MAEDGVSTNTDGSVNMATSAASGAMAGTAIMPGWGTAIGAGVGLIGGALSNMSHEKQSDKGYATQREALQNSIRWRVADAKAAGIHPLYALGAPSMNIAPMTYEDKIGPAVQQMGQAMPDILRGKMSEHERIMQFESYRQMVSGTEKNDAEAFYYRALAAKTLNDTRSVNTVPGLGVQSEMGQDPKGGGQGMIDLKPAENISRKLGMDYSAAGVNPNYEVRMLDNGLPMILPLAQGDSMEETIGEMSFPAWAGLLMRNARHFGPGWLKDMVNSRYLGMEPTNKYPIQSPRNPKPKHK